MNSRTLSTLRGLYLLTPDEPDTQRLVARVTEVIAEGAVLLQYRNKDADAALRRQQAQALLPLCEAHGVGLVINDDWRLAADIGAAGTHLGESDGDLAEARRVLGNDALIGASCYDRLDLAVAAQSAGANYIAFGAFFDSGTKPAARRAPLALLGQARELGLPTVAIGGITPDNARIALAAGADLLAVLGAVFAAANPAAAARTLVSCFESDPQ
ncbi:MAG: thiamine-phosphate diphosphorylase [Gammaproteobacteria bacterium RIFCSPHIGHO2_12_FULL_63_22]|nr:MAG: thiamine-phosphate diphosphorylase [Gammaproteobacteria bacterium RIFCSPHIGHO2_12_FULL_63_22]